ncbi:MAG TPA: hypothetical protein ENN13_01790 [Candidatus Altiarchaeales archaeon]|nr:hypothetical protein [Candidatus Altiarchaeales archaeon]
MNFYKNSLWEKTEYGLSNVQENLELIAYSMLALLVPFAFGHPQMLVGALVNAALILAALNLKNQKLLPIILLPSVGVLARGLIFGPFTLFLVYMMPFIWCGNTILVYSFKKLGLENGVGRFRTLIAGALAKTLFLFTSAFILHSAGILPKIFLTTMGVLQLATALIGGIIAFTIQSVKKTA